MSLSQFVEHKKSFLILSIQFGSISIFTLQFLSRIYYQFCLNGRKHKMLKISQNRVAKQLVTAVQVLITEKKKQNLKPHILHLVQWSVM